MGMFGRRKVAYEEAGLKEPGLSGQILNQLGMNLLGVDFQGQRLAGAQARQRSGFMKDLEGRLQPQYEAGPEINADPNGGNAQSWEYQAPVKTRDALNINSPELAGIAAQATRMGVPISGIMDVLKAQQPTWQVGPDGRSYNQHGANPGQFRNPTNVNGWIADLNKPENEGQYFGKLPDGMIPDGKGGVSNATGLTPAMQAQEEAQALGRTRGTMFPVPRPGGGTGLMTGGQYLGGQGQPGAQGGGFGLSQTPADQEYDKGVAEAEQQRYQGFLTAGQNAGKKLVTYGRIQSLLKDVDGGRLTPVGTEIASALNSVGFKIDKNLGNKQAADALMNQIVLEANGGTLGAGVSNADVAFIAKSGPNMMQSADGRQKLVSFAVAREKRSQDVARMARQWSTRAGRLDKPDRSGKTFYDYLEAWSDANPLVVQ